MKARDLALLLGFGLLAFVAQAGAACAELELTPERKEVAADGEDVGYVTVRVCDAQGRTCPTAKIPLKVTVRGGGLSGTCSF